MLPVIGLGAGGHAKVVIETIQLQEHFEVVGLLDADVNRHGEELLGVPILGGDDLMPELINRGIQHFFVGLGGVGRNQPRTTLYKLALATELSPISVIHPRALISPSAQIGRGATILGYSVVNAEAKIGDNVLINTGAVVEHDCVISDHVHIATGAKLASTVHVHSGAHIGAGAVVRQSLSIGESAIVGAGAAVVHDVAAGTTVVGVPARPFQE